MVCWAAAGTMLCSARDRMCAPVEVIMTRADSNDPGYSYLTMYQGNKGLPPGDTGRSTRAIGLRVGPAARFSVRGGRMLLSRNGAPGVARLTPFLHIRVVTAMFGAGSVFGPLFTCNDPGVYKPYIE